jgi:hypothetical protein
MADLDTSNTSLNESELEEMGPIDYIVIEWPGPQPMGDAGRLIVELADRGLIRILDVAFLGKDTEGAVYAIELSDLDASESFAAFEGASSGLLSPEDLADAANALEPGTSAAVLIWENRWAAPIAVALRRSGGQLVASGRIPTQALAAAIEADNELEGA